MKNFVKAVVVLMLLSSCSSAQLEDLRQAKSTRSTANGSALTNNRPTITGQSFSLVRSAGNGTTVGTVAAHDKDGDIIQYEIRDGNPNNFLSIGAQSGELTVANANAIAGVTSDVITLIVRVSDPNDANAYDQAFIEIRLTDSPNTGTNTRPTTTTQSFSVARTSANGAVVGTFKANDAEGDAISYSIISGNTGNIFALGSNDGTISVKTASNLQSTTAKKISLIVRVQDPNDSTKYDQAFAEISITSGNDPVSNTRPTMSNQELTLNRESAAGTVVGKVSAFDAENDPIHYEIRDGNTNGVMEINSANGNLTVAKPDILSDIQEDRLRLIVRVSDPADASKYDQAFVDLYLEGEATSNENTRPTLSNQTFSLERRVSTGFLVGKVAAFDAQGDSIRYQIRSGNDAAIFALNANNGELTVANADRLRTFQGDELKLIVRVRDPNDAQLYDQAFITVRLAGSYANSRPTMTNQRFSVNRMMANETVFGVVAAHDRDGDPILYEIRSGNLLNSLALNRETGELSVAKQEQLQTLQTSKMDLIVRVSDPSDASKYDQAFVTINLEGQPSNNSTETVYFPADSGFRHDLGRATSDRGWEVFAQANANAFLTSGPNVVALPGYNRATFTLAVDNNTARNDNFARIEIFNATTGNVENSREIYRQEFTGSYVPKDFNLYYNVVSSSHVYEYRVFYKCCTYMKHFKTTATWIRSEPGPLGAPVCNITASPDYIEQLDSTTLTITNSGPHAAETAYLVNVATSTRKQITLPHTEDVSPTRTTDYKCEVYNFVGSSTDVQEVFVASEAPKCTIDVSPNTIVRGESVSITIRQVGRVRATEAYLVDPSRNNDARISLPYTVTRYPNYSQEYECRVFNQFGEGNDHDSVRVVDCQSDSDCFSRDRCEFNRCVEPRIGDFCFDDFDCPFFANCESNICQ